MKEHRSSILRFLKTPEEAKWYANYASRRAKRLGKLYVKMLTQESFNEGRVQEVGSGGGDTLLELATAFPSAELIGLDLSEPLVEIAAAKANATGVSDRLTFTEDNIQSMPFKDDSFDVVVSLNTLHVVDDPVAMFDEIERVLKPEGRFTLSDIKRSWIGRFMKMLTTAFSIDEVNEILTRSKMRQYKIYERSMWFAVFSGEWKKL